jgi:hypothetical protein
MAVADDGDGSDPIRGWHRHGLSSRRRWLTPGEW